MDEYQRYFLTSEDGDSGGFGGPGCGTFLIYLLIAYGVFDALCRLLR